MQYQGKHGEFLKLEDFVNISTEHLKSAIPTGLTFIWFTKPQAIKLDSELYQVSSDQILCLVTLDSLENQLFESVRILHFNRDFYCIKDHDHEVSCKGLLFYNAIQPGFIQIPTTEKSKFDWVWQVFTMEMETKDNLQFEMLQMMLKRFIILCTRLYKAQHHLDDLAVKGLDLIRDFNFLVESHFKKIHHVTGYAELLNKSPKTLANYFSQHNQLSPSQIIQERLMLEARRLLRYTDKSVKEIAYEIGYEDIHTFSRAFRMKQGFSPSDYRMQIIDSGNIAQTAGISD